MSSNDTKTFIKKWWSETNLEYRRDLREWMQNSYINPFPFWEDLFAYSLEKTEPTSPTLLFEKYDFYADCILRNLGQNLVAFKTFNQEGTAESWTYEQIDAYVDAQLAHWMQNHPLQPGKIVALVLPYGIHFIVGLMTALRLGLIVSILPLQDRFFTFQNVLEKLNPDLIVTTSKLSNHENLVELDLTLEKPSSPSSGSHAYAASEAVQQQFNPDTNTTTLIEATRSYLIPLRDALITLNLKRSTVWARPFSSMYQEEPSCTLMALLAGATIFHIPDNLLTSNPKILENEKIDILGVSRPLQELWIKEPGCPSKLTFWYRNPLFGNNHSWKAFSELNRLQKIPTSQLLIDREKGGITLFSQPKPLEILSFLHPSLGSPWKLLKKGASSTEGFGLFQVEPPSSTSPHLIISQIGDEWCIATTTHPLKEGHRYPFQPIEESVKRLDFVQTCMVVSERHPQHFISEQFILLIFISPLDHLLIQQKMESWKQQIHHLIQTTIGEAFIPDQCHFYSIYPKLKKGQLDRNWIENQYRSGALPYKQNRSIYHHLNLVRNSIYENI